MNSNMKRLGDNDAQAVDLLLDQSLTSRDGKQETGNFATPVGEAVAQRIGVAESVLRLVGEMPAAEPPADLTARTMQFIRQRSSIVPGNLEGQQPPLIG